MSYVLLPTGHSLAGEWVNFDLLADPLYSSIDEPVDSPDTNDGLLWDTYFSTTTDLTLDFPSFSGGAPYSLFLRLYAVNPSTDDWPETRTIQNIVVKTGGITLASGGPLSIPVVDTNTVFATELTILDTAQWNHAENKLTFTTSRNTPESQTYYPGIFSLELFVDSGSAPASTGTVSDGLSMFTMGHLDESLGIPLFLKADDVPTVSLGMPLFTNASNESGVFGGIPLYTFTDDDGQTFSKSLPLFLAGSPLGSGGKGLPLSLSGKVHEAEGGIDLFLQQDTSGTSSLITLFISGSGSTDGALETSKGLPLYICRVPSAGMPLYLKGPGELASGDLIPLYMQGAELASGEVPLCVPDVVGYGAASMRLYTHGF